MSYDWDFSRVLTVANLLFIAKGFTVTILVSSISILIGTLIGVCLGVVASLGRIQGMESRSVALVLLRFFTTVLIDIVRSIPLLLLILIVFYGLPSLTRPLSINLSAVSLCIIAMTMNFSAFCADIIRGGCVGALQGSVLAARALGMNDLQIYKRIVLPEVFREVLPSYGLLAITIFKMSTLCSVVSVYEVLHSADAIIQKTYRPLELYVVVTILFVAAILPISIGIRQMEYSQVLRRRSF